MTAGRALGIEWVQILALALHERKRGFEAHLPPRGAEGYGLLAPVYDSFTEGFGFPDLVEARALLEELG